MRLHDNLYCHERARRYECKAVRHLIDHVVAHYESSEIAVVAVVLVTARGSVHTGFGLDKRVGSPACLLSSLRQSGRLVLVLGVGVKALTARRPDWSLGLLLIRRIDDSARLRRWRRPVRPAGTCKSSRLCSDIRALINRDRDQSPRWEKHTCSLCRHPRWW